MPILKGDKNPTQKVTQNTTLPTVNVSGLTFREQRQRKMYLDSLKGYNLTKNLPLLWDKTWAAHNALSENYGMDSTFRANTPGTAESKARQWENIYDRKLDSIHTPFRREFEKANKFIANHPDMKLVESALVTPTYKSDSDAPMLGFVKPTGVSHLPKSNKLNTRLGNISPNVDNNIPIREVQPIADTSTLRYRRTWDREAGRGYEKYVQGADGKVIEAQLIDKSEWYKVNNPSHGGTSRLLKR